MPFQYIQEFPATFLEELPAETRMLFDYNPDLAKQMLADAGYPDGFEIEIVCSPRFDRIGISEMLAGMWKRDLNIDVKIKVLEEVAYRRARSARDFKEAMIGNSHPLLAVYNMQWVLLTGGERNLAIYSDPYFDQLLAEAAGTVDPALREPMLEELFVKALDDVPFISFGIPYWYGYWWPWIKNYYGEYSGGTFGDVPLELMWIDQELKAEMGY